MHASLDEMPRVLPDESARRRNLDALVEHLDVRDQILAFWRSSEHRNTQTWRDHRDINQVMLATGLAPAGFLVPPPLD